MCTLYHLRIFGYEKARRIDDSEDVFEDVQDRVFSSVCDN